MPSQPMLSSGFFAGRGDYSMKRLSVSNLRLNAMTEADNMLAVSVA